MAATLSSLVAPFLDKLSSVIQGEVGEMAGMRSELEELESKIKEIQCLLADAEGRAFYSEAIRVWLKELKEVMYDADDIVDDCKVAGVITASEQPDQSSPVRGDVAGAKLLKEMVACTGVEPGEAHSTEQLQLMLWSLTQGKKILLVLDDIWSADVWKNLLRDPLQGAAAGSKVLITTRFETVAKQVGAVHLHPVAKMNPVEGWFLLCKKVCVHGEELSGLEYLRDVGVKIVERCDGLPLAIKVVGGVLRGRGKNREDWEEVLHSRTWSSSSLPEDMKDMVMEALHLSYEDLPPHLKQCFLYLSLFPEDHVFKRPAVVQQWIAEGFVKAEGDASTLEEIGREYFKELVDRSLLQPELAIEGALCKMHDLLRSLAQFLAEDENFFGSTSDLNGMLSKLRRLSVADGDADIDLDALKSKECLRTLFLLKNPQGGLVLKDDVIGTLDHLRVLGLSGSGIQELPHSIRNLRHLRYLDVSGTAIRELPECIADLRSLEFLLLNNCRNVSALPSGITKLVNLRTLDAYEGTQIDEMPSGIGRLRRLRTLKDFVVDRQKGALEELGSLVDLCVLSISKLERVSDKMQARSAALENKTRILYLGLECTLSTVLAFDVQMMAGMVDVFDELRPPPSLETLHLVGYMGHTLPRWMWPSMPSLTSAIHNLTFLLLNCCFMFSHLPPLGLLPHLKQLWIKGACVVTSVIPEPQDPAPPTHSNIVLFPMLEKLSLLNMPNLEKIWDWRGDGHEEVNLPAFPRLRILYVEDCPKLRRLPDCPSSGLYFLHVEGCPVLMEVGNLRVPDVFNLYHGRSDSVPPWLRQISVGPRDLSAFLHLKVRSCLLKRMLLQKETEMDNPDSDWHIIKRFPRVCVTATDEESAFLIYIKDPPLFNTNVQVTDCSSGVEERGSKKLRAEQSNDGAMPTS
ncbi:hypothetical protein Taro_053055 [Colocasia esculenta]|uniref:Uncharacterized protein n=1 Tax=Colocasia esculenta TaxID=4460 RepID=A0A843XLG1_COLES|nr:hypothetical protein [Colocasia esculenta]